MSTNDKKEMFKTTFKGFDKKGVTEFIRLLSAKYDEDIASKAKELENYKDKLAILQASAKALEEENLSLKEQLKAETEKSAKVSAENADALKAEISSLKEKLNSMKNLQDCAKQEIEAEKAQIAETLITAERLAKVLQEEAVASSVAQKAEIEKQIISKKSELLGINGEIERMKTVFSDLYKKYVSK